MCANKVLINLAGLVVGVAIAAIPVAAHAETVWGCAQQNKGSLRVVSGPGMCLDSEVEVSWDSGSAIGDLQSEVDQLRTRVAGLEGVLTALMQRLACIDAASDAGDVYFEGCNVHVRDGSGGTQSSSGRGNLIVGYDEAPAGAVDKSGTHNLVIGSGHNYSSYGGLVAGRDNVVSGPFASVTGGSGNTAGGVAASVGGGMQQSANNDEGWAAGTVVYTGGATGDVTIDTTGNIELRGSQLILDAATKLKLDGLTTDLNGALGVTVKGALVKIN